MTIRGTTFISRLAALCTLLIALTACGGGGGGFLPAEDGPIDLAITTATLPEATAGTSYTALVEAAGGNPPYSWAITNNNGTDFKIDNDGFVTGTAPTDGDYGLIITVSDSDASTAQLSTILIVITGPDSDSLAITTTGLPPAIEGLRYTAVITAVGGEKPYTWSVTNGGGTGFGINNEGILSGIAPQSGDYGLSLRLTDNANTQTTASFVLTVTGDTPQPLTITTQSLTNGTIDDRYAAVLTASGGDKPYAWKLISNGGQSALVLSSAGVLSGTPTLAGTFGLVIQVSDGISTDQSAITLTIAPAGGGSEVLDITTTGLPDPTRTLYAALVEATGGEQPYSWSGSDISVPGTGFQMDPTSGLITGNTNELLPGQYGYTVTVRGTAGATDTQSYVITVPGGDSPPVRILTENPLPLASETLFYTTILRAVGGLGKYDWSVVDTAGFPGTPPSFATDADKQSGILTWPTVVKGNYLITIQVDDLIDESADIRTYDLQASGPPVRITTDNPLPGGIVGTGYSFQFSTSGGGNRNTWSSSVTRNGSNYPDGPNFTGLGTTRGTLTWPAASVNRGNYMVTVTVVSQDDEGFASENTKVFDLEILPEP